MILPSIKNFLKILNFYQLNDFKSVKENISKFSKYTDSSKFYNSLSYDYDNTADGLNYPEDKDALNFAVNSRIDLSKYFNEAFFPGSYAYNTKDGYRIKSLMLDWASTIKAFQDSTDRINNVYRLSSDEVDKAIRGFGIDFVNSRTLPSLYRRQTFLLNMCDLYKIKGSPGSIIKALNIIGLDDIYIQEAWVYPTRDGEKNVEIKWIPVDEGSELDIAKQKYVKKVDNLETEYWSWGKFNDTLSKILECHWFYTKQEIINLDYDKDTFIHLPSLTPYFNVKIRTVTTEQNYAVSKIVDKLSEQLRNYLNDLNVNKDCKIADFSDDISLLELWNAFLYVDISYSDYLRYNSFKLFLKKFLNLTIDEDITGQHKFFQIIYNFYTYYNENLDKQDLLNQTLKLYSQTAVPLFDCSYNQLKYWWISGKHSEKDDINGLTTKTKIIKPSYIKNLNTSNYIEIYWNEDYPYGYFDIEIFLKSKGWCVLEENVDVRSESMQKIISLQINGDYVKYLDINELYDKIRIVHYRTEDNIPHIFFSKPFNINSSNRETKMDMIQCFNINIIHNIIYENSLFHAIFEKQNENIVSEYTDYDLYTNVIQKFKDIQIRLTDKDLLYKTYINSLIQYPKTLLKEDLQAFYRNTFFEYVVKPTYNYIDFEQHDGSELKNIHIDSRYPLNKKWNWAISYGSDSNETYMFYNYESNKWCRFKSFSLVKDVDYSLPSDLFNQEYGVPLYINGNVFIKVCKSDVESKYSKGCYFVLDTQNNIMESEWNSLSYTRKKFNYTNRILNFLDECKSSYTIDEDGKISVTLPPSDIYPSSYIKKHNYKINDSTCSFYFSTNLFKPDSKLFKEKVVAKLSLSDCDIIYDNVVDCYNENRIDLNSNNNIARTRTFNVTFDPNGSKTVKLYEYKNLLKFIYLNKYIVDIDTGYIYENFDYYLDENNYLYIKCVDLESDDYCDVVKYKWVRVKCSRKWDNNEDRKSIYYLLDSTYNYVLDTDGERISNNQGIKYNPRITYDNVYDSERYLSDYVTKSNKFDDVPDNCNRILKIGSGYGCYVRKDVLSNGKITSIFVKDTKLEKYINKQKVKYNKNKISLFNVVNFGINQDLLDYINTKLIKYSDSSEQYSDLLILLAESINDYITKIFGVKTNLDVYNHHIFKNRLINNIIKFYKPKRDRMLELNSSVEIDDIDRVIGDGISDFEFNHINLNNTDGLEEKYPKQEIGLYNCKSIIKHEINDYVPFDDLVFLDKNNINSSVHSYREIVKNEDTIPVIEYYKNVDLFKNYTIDLKQKQVIPSFYMSSCNEKYKGFYYNENSNQYYFGDYVIINKQFILNTHWYEDEYGVYSKHTDTKTVSINCWCLVTKINIDTENPLKIIYVSNEVISRNPWCDDNGNDIKYRYIQGKLSSIDDFVEQFHNKRNEFNDCIFQVYSKDNLYVKMDLRYIEPSFYIGNCTDSKYNGYYYNTSDRFENPVYTNNRGKMISYYDLSYLPESYIDFNISFYSENKSHKFWIITDYKQIPDISEATYIGYDNNNNIFEDDRSHTITFFPCYPRKDKYTNDYIYLNGIYGHNVNELSDHPEYINKMDRINIKYDNSENYEKYLGRRVSQNLIPEKYTPKSYINFYFNYGLKDTLNNGIVDIEYKQKLKDDSFVDLHLYKNRYCEDDNGYGFGALHIIQDQYFKVIDTLDSESKTICWKAKNCNTLFTSSNDNEWYHYTIVKTKDSCKLYINGKYNSDIEYNNHIEFTGTDCSISEFYIFDIDLPLWYIKIISEYGVYRYRRENNTSEKFSITEVHNSYHGKWMYGLPTRTEGDRVSSKYVDYLGEIYYLPYNPKDPFGSYKWNALSRYYPNNACEISCLWSTKISGRVYDRLLIPSYNIKGEITGVQIADRIYTHPSIKNNGHENYYREYERSMFVDGIEFKVPSNYCVDGDVPIWYIKDPNNYKTGDITHNPVNINIRQKIDDPYPIVHHGEKFISYFDYEHKLDGIQSGNSVLYRNDHYDENSLYVDTIDNFYTEDEFDDQFELYVDRYNVTLSEGHNNGRECHIYDLVNNNIFFDPNIVHITKDMKDNCIYHDYIQLHNSDKIDSQFIGKYYVTSRIPMKQEYDLNYCYSKVNQSSNFNKFNDIIHGLIDNKWSDGKTPNKIHLLNQYVVVPVYHDKSNHYYWEVRKISFYLVNPSTNINIDNKNYIEKTIIKGNDGSEYDYNFYVKMEIVYHTYIKNRYVRWTKENYDFINQYQTDVCGQKLCNYKESISDFLSINYRNYFEQDVVDDVCFVNYDTIKLNYTNKIYRYKKDHFDYNNGRYFYNNNGLYIFVDNSWVGPFKTIDEELPNQLYSMVCGIDCVYINTKKSENRRCYFKVQEGMWVSVKDFGIGYINNTTYEPFLLEDVKNVFINLPKTDPKLPYWSYYVDTKNIMTTMREFKELYEVGMYEKNEEYGVGFINKQTITDFMWLKMYYICQYPIDQLCFIKLKEVLDFKQIDEIKIDEIIPYRGIIPGDPCHYNNIGTLPFKQIDEIKIDTILPYIGEIGSKCNYLKYSTLPFYNHLNLDIDSILVN